MVLPILTLVVLSFVVVTHVSPAVAQTQADTDRAIDDCSRGILPPNVRVHGVLNPVALRLLATSSLFVRQCQRLAVARHVYVDVVLDPRVLISMHRATALIRRNRSGAIQAEVAIGLSDDHEELLAHEFEHVLEQLDGWDLRRLVRVPGAGVRITLTGAFETQRAIDAGLYAAREAARQVSADK